MKNVVTNPILIEKMLLYCDMPLLTTLSKITKTCNNTMFHTIDNFYWKKKCLDDFNASSLSWYDLYCALSNENYMKQRNFRLRKSYINVANCCKCRVYCKSCAKPMTQSDEVEMTCPHCEETNHIDDFEILHKKQDNVIGDRGYLSYVCKECRLFK